MSAPEPLRTLSRRIERLLPENGYESPREPENEDGFFGNIIGNGTHRVGGRKPSRRGQTSVGVESPEARNDVSRSDTGLVREEDRDGKKVGIRDRVGCYTWTWFTMTMATGGIANVLHSIPYRSDWLDILGVIVFLFNLGLFILNAFFITLRFRWNPGSLIGSLTSPSESLFVPACVIGTILINMCQYGIPRTGQWLQTTMQVCYWAYLSLSVVASSGMYLIIWSTQTFPIHTMTPIWIFPAYPLLLMGPLAANLIDALPDAAAAARINSIAIALAAICIQGTGFLVSLMIYSAFIYRLMTQKLPRETTRPGMFVSVGPSGFTVAGLVHLGNTVIPKIAPNGYFGNPDAAFFLKLLSDLTGLWLWGLCLWFFLVSIGAHWQIMRPNDPEHHIQFDMTWFSFVFPNTALVTATQALGKSLSADAIKIFGTVLAGLLVLVWIFVFYMMIRALFKRRLLWPGANDGLERRKSSRG
ncbi:hypothetical protein NA56DRAFT_561651 [Hyaloscypha hepaticicola]|uniref:C4-dicarboxylate transporter/malic acid transport protein n=1 Tax=Hyaloscypha hepaticicola TaxID=2082293 RepID=A0A2J6QL54_9HELO|nr:hypothetical protein NA56DRAFT_561651 [Hyaloscypha hepaticicola]